MLDPRERCTIAECLEHAAFETERLLHRNNTSAVGRRARKQSAARAADADNHNLSRPASVIRSKTPNNIVTEVRFTPIPPADHRSMSPDHPGVVERRRATPAANWPESDSLLSHAGAEQSAPDATRHSSDTDPNTHTAMEPSGIDSVQEAIPSRFLRKKPVTGSKSTEEEGPLDPRAASVLPAVDDLSQKERGSTAISSISSSSVAAVKKTYCVNVCGAAVPVPAHRNKKNAAQTCNVNAVTIKGGPVTEHKNKVCISHSYRGIVLQATVSNDQ